MSHMEQVKASAGSGKTHDITQRFLAHLARSEAKAYKSYDGVKSTHTADTPLAWGDIMAMTFTNMAAAEMKERVLQSLKKCALTKEGSTQAANMPMPAEKAKAWIEIILRQYGALNIRTIDSLLHLVVRTAALDLGLPPDFESSFHIQELMDPMFDELLEQADQGDAAMLSHVRAMCRALVFHKDKRGFVLGSQLQEMLLPLVDFFVQQEDLAIFSTLSSAEQLEDRLQILELALITSAKHLITTLEQENLKVNANAKKCFALASAGDKKGCTSTYASKENVDACLLKASQGQASDAVHWAYATFTQSVHAVMTEGKTLRVALQMQPFAEVALLLAQKMLDFQKQESKVPAAKIPVMARQVLQGQYGVSAALCRLGNNVRHVLLDEFQDTSGEQWQALLLLMQEALSYGGSLTWVGDVKQAIYGWRGGDSALFDAVLREESLTCMLPEPHEPKQKNLPTNWRSREVIVATNNALFAPLADEAKARALVEEIVSSSCPPEVVDAAAKKLCATFTGAAQQVKPDAEGGYVCIEEVQGANAEELSEAVRDLLQEKLTELGQRRPWADITILTRQNKAASMVAAWLSEWGIPAVTENSLLLQNHPLIQESLAFLSFLHCPQDDLHFWTVLTGQIMAVALRPEHVKDAHDAQEEGFVGNIRPSLEELHNWVLLHKSQRGASSLAHAFQKQWPEFWEYTFAPFYGAAQMRSPYDCMQEWYRLWQVPQRYEEAQTFLRRFLEVIFSAQRRGAGTLGTFLQHWEQSGGEEKTPTPSKLDAVNIMTIHKSKGLQFPVVIIPWLSFGVRDSAPPMVQKVGDLQVLATRTKQSESLEEEEFSGQLQGHAHYMAQAEGVLECFHVLYVACTRAQEELYAFHTHTPHVQRTVNLAKGLPQLWEAMDIKLPHEAGYGIEKDMPVAEDSVVETATKEKSFACPVDFSEEPQRIMQWLPRLKIYRDPVQECLLHEDTAGEESQGSAVYLSPARRGLLMHHCLEVWQSMQHLGSIEDNAKTAATLGVQSFGLPLMNTESMEAEMAASLVWYASLPGVQEWAEYALPEQGMVNESGKEFRADLVLPPHDGHGWRVVEFKTGQEDAAHVTQVRNYVRMLDDMPHGANDLPASQGLLVYLDLKKCRMVQTASVSELLDAPLWQSREQGA